jgi:hypothetical protein
LFLSFLFTEFRLEWKPVFQIIKVIKERKNILQRK